MERASNTLLAFDPDVSAVCFDDSLTNRKADTGAGNVSIVKPLKYAEDSVVIVRSNPNSVIGERELNCPIVNYPAADVNSRLLFRQTIPNTVGNEVLEQLE